MIGEQRLITNPFGATLQWEPFDGMSRWEATAADPEGDVVETFGHVGIDDDTGKFDAWRYEGQGCSASLTGSKEPPLYPCLCSAKAAIEASFLELKRPWIPRRGKTA